MMFVVRSLFTRAWILLLYAIPTSSLLLFAASYGVDSRAISTAALSSQSSSIAFGNRELVALVVMLGVLLLLSMGSAIQYWLDARKAEMFMRFLSGASEPDIVSRVLGLVFSVNGLGFAASVIAYVGLTVALGGRLDMPAITPVSLVVAFAATSALVTATTSVGVLTAVRRLDRTRSY